MQAYRYSYFADESIVVMPESSIGPALSNTIFFERLGIGLWSFDKIGGKMDVHVQPHRKIALHSEAKGKAIASVLDKIDFRKSRKSSNTLSHCI